MWSFCTADGYQSLFSICLVSSKNKRNCGVVMQRKLAACMITQPVPEDTLKKKLLLSHSRSRLNIILRDGETLFPPPPSVKENAI